MNVNFDRVTYKAHECSILLVCGGITENTSCTRTHSAESPYQLVKKRKKLYILYLDCFSLIPTRSRLCLAIHLHENQ